MRFGSILSNNTQFNLNTSSCSTKMCTTLTFSHAFNRRSFITYCGFFKSFLVMLHIFDQRWRRSMNTWPTTTRFDPPNIEYKHVNMSRFKLCIPNFLVHHHLTRSPLPTYVQDWCLSEHIWQHETTGLVSALHPSFDKLYWDRNCSRFNITFLYNLEQQA